MRTCKKVCLGSCTGQFQLPDLRNPPQIARYHRYPIPVGFYYDTIPFEYNFRGLRELRPWLLVIIYLDNTQTH